jgi:hypothetical protein
VAAVPLTTAIAAFLVAPADATGHPQAGPSAA